jgi:hypothetical protein
MTVKQVFFAKTCRLTKGHVQLGHVYHSKLLDIERELAFEEPPAHTIDTIDTPYTLPVLHSLHTCNSSGLASPGIDQGSRYQRIVFSGKRNSISTSRLIPVKAQYLFRG